jgi:hypothetical protein
MRDLREYAKRTNIRLGLGAFLLLFVVGLALIWAFYGEQAAGMGLICLMAALFPILLIFFVFAGIEWILKHARPK